MDELPIAQHEVISLSSPWKHSKPVRAMMNTFRDRARAFEFGL